ncbi:DUF2798 domain-containing protein [Terrarubrum flagellatum]|uniref:DUF2798 domain-containing protein n=1 Tax=Terrirubrum flagellatum TaxID=2895980 RepID=UPI003144F465
MDGKARYIFPVLMGGMMAFMMTAIVTAVNFGGVPPDFVGRWMRAFIIAWPCAAVAAFIAAPFARLWTAKIVARIESK